MRWTAQIGHVAAKDVRQSRWLLLGYLAVVVMAGFRAASWPVATGGYSDVWTLTVVAVGIFVHALVVQSDSPTRTDSFWASRPLDSSAVLLAKVIVGLVALMAAPILVEIHVLRQNDLRGTTVLATAAWSAAIYGTWLGIAMILAALTRDIRSFAIAIIVVPVVGIVAASTSGRYGTMPRSPAGSIVLGSVGVMAMAAVLVLLYRTRTARRMAKLVTVAAIAATFFALTTAPWAARPADASLAMPNGDFGAVVELANADQPRSIFVGFDRVVRWNQLALLETGSLVLRLRDGTFIVKQIGPQRFELTTPPIPVGMVVRWPAENPDGGKGGRYQLPLTRAEQVQIRVGVASATIEGIATILEPTLAMTVPFAPGATGRRNGTAVRVMTVNPLASDSLGVVAEMRIGMSRDIDRLTMGQWATPRYVLINPSRHEAIAAPGASRGGSESMVLPGAARTSYRSVLGWSSRVQALGFGSDWLRGANLAVIDWTVRGRAPVHIDAIVGKLAIPNEPRAAAPGSVSPAGK